MLTVPERLWDLPSSQPGLCRMGCGRCSGGRTRGSQVRGALAVREGLGPFCARWTDLWASCGGPRRLQRSGLGRPVVLENTVTASAVVARRVKQGGGCGACGKDIWSGSRRWRPWHPWPWPLPVRGGPATSATLSQLCAASTAVGRLRRQLSPLPWQGSASGAPPPSATPHQEL